MYSVFVVVLGTLYINLVLEYMYLLSSRIRVLHYSVFVVSLYTVSGT